jgi:phage gpG-like protein
MEVRVQDNSAAFIAALKRQCPKALEQIGKAAVKHAQDEIQKSGRIKTGAMFRSIRYEVRKDGVYIGTNDKKAVFHELGTGKFTKVHRDAPYGVKAVHFIHHAAARHTAEYRAILKRALQGGL